ncbi:unnamed protein product [Urochloa humidicola]
MPEKGGRKAERTEKEDEDEKLTYGLQFAWRQDRNLLPLKTTRMKSSFRDLLSEETKEHFIRSWEGNDIAYQ